MGSRSKQLSLKLLFAIGMASLLIAGSASAQLAGIAVTPTSVDPETLDVDATLTVWYGFGTYYTTAWVGDTSGYGPVANALEWGDGANIPPYYPAGIPFDTTSTPPNAPGAVRAYRAAVSHTYPAEGIYTATIASHAGQFATGCCFTGNTATFQTPTYSIFGGTRMVLTNTAEIDLSPAPMTPTIEIDTVSDLGLLLLALAIGAAGMFLMKRG